MLRTYTYREISLVPRKLSKIYSRMDIDLSVNIGSEDNKILLKMPIVPAPMDTICSIDMNRKLNKNNLLGIVQRFKSFEKRIKEYKILREEKLDAIIALGLNEEEMAEEFYKLGAKFFIIDVANGFNVSVESMVKKIKKSNDTFVICGNVASKEGFKYLSDLGVDAIRVGIGNGSMCTTSIMTGVGQGIASAISECKECKEKNNYNALIIADGGISNVGDIAKALSIGADLVMMGRMFAGTKEAQGNILKYNDKLYKTYRGSASFAVQKKSKESPYYVEGDETIVEYKGSVQKIIDKIEAGLRSSFSYMASKNIKEFRENSSIVVYNFTKKSFL